MRRYIIVLAATILAGSTFAAAVGLWVDAEVVDEDAFIASSLESFAVEGSYDAIGASMAAKVIDAYPSLGLLQATLETLFAALVATEPFEPLLVDVATQVYEVAVDGSGNPIVIDLAEYRDVVLASLAAIAPDLAARVPPGVFTSFELFTADELPDASFQIDAMTTVGWIAVVVAMAMVVLLVMFLRRGRLALGSIGTALLVGAGAVAVFIPLGRLAAGRTFTNEAYLVLSQNLYDTLVIPLWQRAWIVAGAGLVLVGVAVIGSLTRSRWQTGGG